MLGLFDDSTNNRVFTEKLLNAVKTFQKSHDLAPSGILDIPTQTEIEKEFAQLETVEDVQRERAYEMLGGKISDLY